jgi:hypothetical protein
MKPNMNIPTRIWNLSQPLKGNAPMDATRSIEDQVSPSEEQRTVPAIDDVGTSHQPDIADAAPRQAEEPAAPESPVDKRAARLEEIAERSRERSFNELERSREAFGKPETAASVTLGDDDKIVLKVRKNAVEMTVKQRNDLLAEELDSDEIAVMSEVDKKAFAQRILANRSYDEELARKRDEVSARPVQQPVMQQQPEQPAEPQKTPLQVAKEKLADANRMIALGENLEEAVQMQAEATSELIKIGAAEVAQNTNIATRQAEIAARYDRDALEGLEKIVGERPEFREEVAGRVLSAQYATIQRAAIDYYLTNADPQVQQAFVNAGIRREQLLTSDASYINALYKDMIVKGHRIPPPSALLDKAAELTATKLFGTTPPQPTGHTQPAPNGQQLQQPTVDRSDRKAALHQPARAGIPKHGEVQQPPLSEQERAKAAIAEEKRLRRGRPIKR